MPVALLFPGQGSQHPAMFAGMEHTPEVDQLMERARDMGCDLRAVLATGDAALLTQTQFAQPALFIASVVVGARVVRSLDVCVVAGHSVGELAAAVVAGFFSLEDGLSLVIERGRLMAAMATGSMAALIGVELAQVEEWCTAVAPDLGHVVVANDNAPGQIVVSGTAAALKELYRIAQAGGARRIVELSVGGAFHSPLMHEAARQFAMRIEAMPMATPSLPLVANYSGDVVSGVEEFRQCLTQQMEHRVQWTQSVRCIAGLGATMAVECGPGKVLSSLVHRTDPSLKCVQVPSIVAAADFLAQHRGVAVD